LPDYGAVEYILVWGGSQVKRANSIILVAALAFIVIVISAISVWFIEFRDTSVDLRTQFLNIDKSWRENATIINHMTEAISQYPQRIDEGRIFESPYVVVLLDSTSVKSEIMNRAWVWDKPFSTLTDENIEEIKTFVFVENKRVDYAGYTDGGSISTYETVIYYAYDSDERVFGDIVTATPLPDKRTYNTNKQHDYKASKNEVLKLIKTRFSK
jgi:hypothetical protein